MCKSFAKEVNEQETVLDPISALKWLFKLKNKILHILSEKFECKKRNLKNYAWECLYYMINFISIDTVKLS